VFNLSIYNNKNDNKINLKKVGIVILVFAVLTFLVLLTNFLGFYKSFLIGTFGYFIYPCIILMGSIGAIMFLGKEININKSILILSIIALVCFLCVLQLSLTSSFNFSSYGTYLYDCYTKYSPSGVIIGILVYPIKSLFFDAGAYVLYLIGLVLCIALLFDNFYSQSGSFLKNLWKKEEKQGPNIDNLKLKEQKDKLNQEENKTESAKDIAEEEKEEEKISPELQKQMDAREVLYGNGFSNLKNKKTDDGELSYNGSTEFIKTKIISNQTKINNENISPIKNSSVIENTEKETPKVDYSSYTSKRNIVYNADGIISGDNYKKEDNKPNLYNNVGVNYDVLKQMKGDIKDNAKEFLFNGDNDTTRRFEDFAKNDNIDKKLETNSQDSNTQSLASQNLSTQTLNTQNVNNTKNDNYEDQPQDIDLDFDGKKYSRESEVKSMLDGAKVSDNSNSDYGKLHESTIDSNAKNDVIKENNSQNSNTNQNVNVPNNEKISPIEKTITKLDNIESKINIAPITKPYSIDPINNGDSKQEKVVEEEPYVKPPKYIKPPIELLRTVLTDDSENRSEAIIKKDRLEQVLESFKVPAKVNNIIVGPAVTRYELTMPIGISVKKITGYSNDIALALESKGGVRIEAPIPGTPSVGIEVPNKNISMVGLKEVLQSNEFILSKSPLTFVLGKDISGKYRVCDLKKLVHLLIAGTTGSGKSVCLNSLILSLLYKSSPEDVRLILIDPKRVEFSSYSGMPHLMLPKIITDADKALNAFDWAINEMERRYTLFSEETAVKSIEEYNAIDDVVNAKKPKLPYIVIIVDELSDLFSQNKSDFESKIIRLTQKSRAAGMYLVLATQRPSVDIITGVIKANLPSRIAFAVASYNDSKTILDSAGAEQLLGKGDMLFQPLTDPSASRIQGAFVSSKEIDDVVNFVKENNKSIFESNIENKMLNKVGSDGSLMPGGLGQVDEFFVPALRIAVQAGEISASSIQRVFSLGFPRASRIVDSMEALKYIAPKDGSKTRTVYLSKEDFERLYEKKDNNN
jgi:S-DNA-T family DNA segregation ATPase FtsK/SpoIIIE